MKRKPIFVLIPVALFCRWWHSNVTWNWLIPVIFGLKAITYFQALGLFLLSRILLGSFGFGNKNHLLPIQK
ncbi:MAG: hypothetical protein IPO64_17030 [Bacteroidetes bacterium]|nr:hypothetical protein [Bacteroidota bacterium]